MSEHRFDETAAAIRARLGPGKIGQAQWCRAEVEALVRLQAAVDEALADESVGRLLMRRD